MFRTISQRPIGITLFVTILTSVGARGQVIKVTLPGTGSPPPCVINVPLVQRL